MPRLHRTPRIALIYDSRLAYDMQVMSGVAAYLQERGDFNIFIEGDRLKKKRLPDLQSWKGDGIISNFDFPLVAEAVAQSKIPAVGFGGGYGWHSPKARIPYVYTDNQAIARMAASHLLERGFRHFAFCGYPRTRNNGWSEEREKAFAEIVKKHGFDIKAHRGRYRSSHRWADVQRSLGVWLRSLPKPIGLMAANDYRARQVLEACRAFSIRVPEEIAVIGVDNDELLCQLASPQLTSIEQGTRKIGYEAAALLDKIMHGEKPPRFRYMIGPVGIVTRQSTDFLALSDPKIAQAMSFIEVYAKEGIKVKDVAEAVAISRSGLESRFASALGYTVHAAIRRVQMERARRFVLRTNLPLKQIAAEAGFKSVQHMTTLFGKAFGQPPAEYRRSNILQFSAFAGILQADVNGSK